MDENKFWYKLLYYKCFIENKTGLTLPFLIGSQYECKIEKPINIEQLLIEIRNSDKKINCMSVKLPQNYKNDYL